MQKIFFLHAYCKNLTLATIISKYFFNRNTTKIVCNSFVKNHNITVAKAALHAALHANRSDNLQNEIRRFRSSVAPKKFNENVILPCCRITAKIDDDMIRYYVDEDLFLLEVSHSRINPDSERNPNNPGSPGDPGDPGDPPTNGGYDVTLIELPSSPPHMPHSPLANSTHGHAHVHDNSNT